MKTKIDTSAKAQHTPGPLMLSTICGENCLMIGGGDGSEPVIADFRMENPNVEHDSNLFAAAPDLLAALENSADAIDAICAGILDIEKAKSVLRTINARNRSVIARAKGEN